MTCFELRTAGRRFFVEFETVDDRTVLRLDGGKQRIVRVEETLENDVLNAFLDLDERPRKVCVLDVAGPVLSISVDGSEMNFERTPMTELDPPSPANTGNTLQSFPDFPQKEMSKDGEQRKNDPNSLISPFPGKIVAIVARPGQRLSVGETILVVESMKMETKILAEREVTIVEILAVQGASIKKGEVLVRFQ